MTESISILIADDHEMFRSMLARRLEDEPDLTVVGVVENADQAIERARQHKPDIVLMDILMPGVSAFDATRTIQESLEGTRVIFLSGAVRDTFLENAVSVEAWGYISKQDSIEELVDAIRKVRNGFLSYSADVQSRFVTPEGESSAQAQPRLSTLTRREKEVLSFITQGLTEKEIGVEMNISLNTVHRHTVNLMRKLDIHNRIELVRFAIREGLAEA